MANDRIDFSSDSPDVIVMKINRKYNQIFSAKEHISKDFVNLSTLISNIEKTYTDLKAIEDNYDDTKKSDENKVYTINNVPQVPKWIDKVLNCLYKKGSKEGVLYNLKNGAKKCVAAYYRKEKDDCVRYIEYLNIAIRQCNANIRAKKKGNWSYAIRKAKAKGKQANSRITRASNNEKNARNNKYSSSLLGASETMSGMSHNVY